MVVKWSAYLPSTPMIRVRILLKATVFFCKSCIRMKENKQKEARFGHFLTILRVKDKKDTAQIIEFILLK